MKSDELESSKFYSYKFKNFSTIIILPAFILVVILFIGSFFATKENVIQTLGVIEPQSSIKIKDTTYNEGDVVPAGEKVSLSNGKKTSLGKQSIVHISDKDEIVLFPDINKEKKLELISYVPGQDVASLKKKQKIKFELNDRDNGTTIITGKIKSISVYPEMSKNQSEYEVISIIKPTEKEKKSLRYGMQGQTSVITGKETYFNYLKSLFLDEK